VQLETSERHWGPPPKRYYTLIYRYRGKGSNTWTHRFTSYDGRRLSSSVYGTDTWTGNNELSWPPLMQFARKASWERCAESAKGWFGTFSFMLRWAVILDPDGRVVFDWKRHRRVP
jgi:hypothetical protein